MRGENEVIPCGKFNNESRLVFVIAKDAKNLRMIWDLDML